MRMYNRSMLVAGGLALLAATALVQAQGDTSHYRVLGADNGKIAIVDSKGQVEWEIPNGTGANHDIQLLPNGNILLSHRLDDDQGDHARQEGRVEVRADRQARLHGPVRAPRIPAAAERQHDGRRERQPAHHRGGQGRQDRSRDSAGRSTSRTRTATRGWCASCRAAATSSATRPTARSGVRPRRQGGVGVRAGVERDAGVEGREGHGTDAVRRQAAGERQHPDRRRQQQPRDRGQQGRRDRLERRGRRNCPASRSRG